MLHSRHGAALPDPPRPERLVGRLRLAAIAVLLLDLAVIALLLAPGLVPTDWRLAARLLDAGLMLVLAVLLLSLLDRLSRLLDERNKLQTKQQMLFDAMPIGLVVWDADGRMQHTNAHFRQLYAPIEDLMVAGTPFEAVMRAAVERGLVPQARGREDSWFQERLLQHRNPGPPLLRQMADGRWRTIVEERLRDGRLLGYSVDVTEVQQARAAEAKAIERLHDAIEALPAGFELYDANDRMVLVNSTTKRMYPMLGDLLDQGISFAELVRTNWERGNLIVPCHDIEAYIADRLAQRSKGGPPQVHQLHSGQWVRTYECRTREGGIVGVRIDVTELIERDRELAEVIAKLDVANMELLRQAETDPLTAVANRRRFERELAAACEAGQAVSLLLFDIDYFKRFNDLQGHPAGDACLRRVAAVLTAALRGSDDLAARLGGEEFAVLLPGEGAEAACAVAQRCAELLADAQISHGNSPLGPHVTFSVGIAAGVGVPAATLIERTDAALYQAKKEGRACWRLHRFA